MKIPEQFIIHGQVVKVIQKEIDSINGNRYGYYDRLVTRLYWDQLMLEVKLAALDYMKTWKEEFKNLLLHDIAIISVGDEIY